MSRYRASGIHLAISASLGILLFLLFWFVWYPSPLFRAVGGQEIFSLLLAIDVVLGPLLTFVVFRAEKKSLRFDLAVIAAVQASAMAYGVHTLLAGRPVYVAALGHRFDVIQASEIEDAELRTSGKNLPWFGPEWVGTKLAENAYDKERIFFSAALGMDYGHYPQYHQPLETMRDEILKKAKSLDELRKLNLGRAREIDQWLVARRLESKQVVFQGLRARNQDMAVMLSASTATVIGVAPFKPWP